jgi:D-alanyl-D-alanine carboxypeptidase
MAWRFPIDSQLGRFARFVIGALISASAFAFASAPAEAHRYWRVHHYARYHAHYGHVAHAARHWVAAVPASPAFSALVVDANSGRTLYSVAEDALRHPASITKVMTLYLLFEQLDKGAMALQTQIPISEHAAAQEPSKLGIEAGDTITVDDAIKAVVTRSANDVAVAIAEAIGHDESTFADMMTRKAHALGMSSTVYRNASGLPNDQQVTTAHDLTILARSLEERFPRYFRYFSTHDFVYAGEIIGNHNHLLGRVDGVDGIKTGYTRASGFNLLTSLHRDGRSLIAVVMGGRTAGARDRIMEAIIEDHIAEGSTAHTATMVADASQAEGPERYAEHPAPVAANVSSRVTPSRPAQTELAEGDNTEEVEGEAQTPHVAAVAPVPARPVDRPAAPRITAAEPSAPVKGTAAPGSLGGPAATRPRDFGQAKVELASATVSEPSAAQRGWVKGPDPVSKGQAMAQASILVSPAPTKSKLADVAGKTPADTTVAARAATKADDDEVAIPRGWMIQIGATDDAAKASALLARARERNPSALAAATPLTEKVRKGEDTFYRARFAGLDPASAQTACRSLKRNGFPCFAAPN